MARESFSRFGKEHTFYGWEDLRFPAQGINPAGSPAPAAVDTADGTLTFSASATNVIAGVALIPHSWLQGSPLRPHIHWCPTTTGSGNVYWRFEYEVRSIGGIYTGFATVNTLAAAGGVAEKHQVHNLYTTEIDMTGVLESAIMKWKISRIGGDGTDNYAAVARLLEFDIHYLVGKPGTFKEIPRLK